MKNEYTIGADPELFVEDTETHAILSAHDLIPGNKIQPMEVEYGAIQCDGTAAEFNIRPAKTASEFTYNIRRVLESLQDQVRHAAAEKHHAPVTLKVQPTVFFDVKYFNELPGEALAFGCTPDFNAWTGDVNEFYSTQLPMRTGGGHVHVGWTEDEIQYEESHIFDCQQATMQLDAALFIPSLLWDSDRQRRTLYGQVGSFRPKPYGVEYRPLSNAWVADPMLQVFVFETTKRAMELLDQNDNRLWQHGEIKSILERARKNIPIAKDEIVDCHFNSVDRWGLPPVPRRYASSPVAVAA